MIVSMHYCAIEYNVFVQKEKYVRRENEFLTVQTFIFAA